jgi:hypothetical protein
MKRKQRHPFRKTLTALAAAFALTACGGISNQDDDAPVGLEDVVEVDDLLVEDLDDASAAGQVGEPAELLAEAQRQGTEMRQHIRNVVNFIKDVIQDDDGVRRAPDNTGLTPDGRPFAMWQAEKEGVMVRFRAVRINAQRVRYLLTGQQMDADVSNAPAERALLTGIFVKKAPRKGGGRLHLNLSAVSDLFEGPNADGSMHLLFANHRPDLRGRRMVYRNVVSRDDANAMPKNYGADLIHKVGLGGRFRSVAIGDIIPQVPGIEALGMRVLWKHGQGGRADVAVANVLPEPRRILGHAHECWDAEGLRTAYADTIPENDDVNPNEGDVTDGSLCGDFGAPDANDANDESASADGQDMDPELEDLLEDADATDITEEEADEEASTEAGAEDTTEEGDDSDI